MKSENKEIELISIVEDYTEQKNVLDFRISNLDHTYKTLKELSKSNAIAKREEIRQEKSYLNRELELIKMFLRHLNKLK